MSGYSYLDLLDSLFELTAKEEKQIMKIFEGLSKSLDKNFDDSVKPDLVVMALASYLGIFISAITNDFMMKTELSITSHEIILKTIAQLEIVDELETLPVEGNA